MIPNEKLQAIGEQLRTQNNRCTADPMFCVQGRRRIYGVDPQWQESYVWVDKTTDDEECDPPEDENKPPEGYEKIGYIDIWETVAVCFTEAGCETHLKINGHNYRRFEEVRIYAESFHRNPEMLVIRHALMEQNQIKIP